VIRDRRKKAYDRAVNGEISGELTVGVHAPEGAQQHSDGPTVLQIAEWNEFGLGVPQRSFVRAWFDEQKGDVHLTLRDQLRGATRRGDALQTSLNRVALFAQGRMQKRIADGIEPENAPSTIARKGSSKPLIDKGILRAAITAKAKAA